MPQLESSRNKRRFYRQTFEIKANGATVYRHTLLINPEDMSIDEPHRANVQQTLGGAYLSMFGQGLQTVNISGKTGFAARRNAEGVYTDGYQEIRNLRKRVYRDFIKSPSSQYEMFWYNWEDEEYYKIIPMSMRVQRNTSGALMYRYEIQFICIAELGAQTKPDANNLVSAVDALKHGKNIAKSASTISEVLKKLLNRKRG